MNLAIEAAQGQKRALWTFQGGAHEHSRGQLADGAIFKGDLHEAHAAGGAQGRFSNQVGFEKRLQDPLHNSKRNSPSTQKAKPEMNPVKPIQSLGWFGQHRQGA